MLLVAVPADVSSTPTCSRPNSPSSGCPRQERYVRAHSSVGERSSHVPVQELGDLLREIDADGNGRIDLDEFIVLMQLLT
jgi:hypothetical protein